MTRSRRVVPTMRERSFMKSLFFGVIDDSLIFPWPEPPAQEVDTVRALLDGIRSSGKLPEGDKLETALRSFTDSFDTGKGD